MSDHCGFVEDGCFIFVDGKCSCKCYGCGLDRPRQSVRPRIIVNDAKAGALTEGDARALLADARIDANGAWLREDVIAAIRKAASGQWATGGDNDTSSIAEEQAARIASLESELRATSHALLSVSDDIPWGDLSKIGSADAVMRWAMGPGMLFRVLSSGVRWACARIRQTIGGRCP